jgi:hypothetical protein
MNELIIFVEVDRATAIAAGISRYGKMTFKVTDQFLDSLGKEQREAIAIVGGPDIGGTPLKLTSASVTPEAVSDALWSLVVAARTKAAESDAKELAKLERIEKSLPIIRAYFAEPNESIVTHGWGIDCGAINYPRCSHVGLEYMDVDINRDFIAKRIPDLMPRIIELEMYIKDVEAKRKIDREAAKAASEAKELEADSRRQAAEAALVEYVKDSSVLGRAAAEGYDVVGQAIESIARQIATAACEKYPCYWGGNSTDRSYQKMELEEREAPYPYAFQVLDAVTNAVKQVPLPYGFTITVDRIQRAQLEDSERWTTVVVVRLESEFWMDQIVMVRAEQE